MAERVQLILASLFFYVFISRLGVLFELSTCKHFRFNRLGKLKPIITQSLEYSAAATKGTKAFFFFKNDVHLYNVGDPITSILGHSYNYFSRLIIVPLLKNFPIDGEFLIDFKQKLQTYSYKPGLG